jgi:hypothetical protein
MSMNVDEFDHRPDLVKKRARAIIIERFAMVFVAAFIVASIVLLVIINVQGQGVRDTLLDCTQPGGECYSEGQQRTAKFIQQLIDANNLGDVATQRIVVIASACADLPGVGSVDEIQKCVNDRLDADKAKKGGE